MKIIDKISPKLDSGIAYLVYCIILVVIAVFVLTSAHIYTQHGIITEMIAAFIAAIITSLITRILLKQQTKSNKELVEQEAEENAQREYRIIIAKDRYKYSHLYLDMLATILEDGKVTSGEIVRLNIAFQHLFFNIESIVDEENYEEKFGTQKLLHLTNCTKEIITEVNNGDFNTEHINKNLLEITHTLHKMWYDNIEVESQNDINEICKLWSQISSGNND